MADARADIIIDVDTSVGIAEIKALQRQISQLNAQLLSSGAQQARQAQNIQRNLINNINATEQFSARVKTITSTTESFTRALESNKMSMGQYFKYAGASTKTFGRLFRGEFDTIQKVAESRVKTLQTQYVKLGRDANGALKAIAVRPLALDMENLATKTAIAAQKQQLFNQLLKQGSTNLLNFGKNTQWAGRQLMVGFSVPLAYLGTIASKTFMKMEEQAIRFKRVYGDSFTSSAETDKMIKQVQQLASEFTKYGVQVEKTMEMAANAAAMGKQGADLLAQVNQATRLAVLGGVEQQQALETTISLTNAFGIATEELAGKINFLNAVENQTVTSIEDLTIAVPKAGPVIQQLGGDVEDLAFFLTAMKEGGINASEGANALKSGLASLINPTDKASKFLHGFGINIKSIVEANKGDVKGLVVDFASALDTLDPLNRARSIEQLFGKFQFSRLSTLFQNVIAQGSQAERVLQLTKNSTEELAILSERELKRVEDSPMYKFKKAVEDLKVSLVPLGEAFLKAITPLVEFAKGFLDKFNSMGEGAKNFAVIATTVVAGIGPVLLMTFGLIANGVANLIKMFSFIGRTMSGAGKSSMDLGAQTEYMTQQQLEAAAIASSLDQKHAKLTQTFNIESGAVNNLATAYGRAVVNQSKLLGINPETGMPVTKGAKVPRPKRYNSGVISVPGPKGKGDIVPAMLAPGEAVIPADMAKKHRGFIADMINDRLPGYRFGLNPFASMLSRSRVAVRTKQSDLEAMLQAGRDGRYKSAFETGTGADYISTAGLANPAQARLRSQMEEKMFGLGPNTPASQRPTYGYARTSPFQALINKLFGFKGKQYNAVTSGFTIGDRGQAFGYKNPKTGMFGPTPNYKKDVLQRYGDIDLITKRSVARRSSGAVTDALMDYSRSSIPGLFKLSPVSLSGKGNNNYNNAKFDRLSNPFGSYKSDPVNYPNQYTSNPKPPYVETYTPGGFGVKEISKIIAKDKSAAREIQRLVDKAGLRIRVTPQNAPLAIKMLANIFGTRFSNGTTNASTASTTGLIAAHGADFKRLSDAEAREFAKQNLAKDSRAYNNFMQPTGRGRNIYSNLVFGMPGLFNTGNMTGTDAARWIRGNRAAFFSYLTDMQGLDPNSQAAKKYASSVALGLSKFGDKKIDDSRFYSQIAKAGTSVTDKAFTQALNRAASTYATGEVFGSSGKSRREALAGAGTSYTRRRDVVRGLFNDRALAFEEKILGLTSKPTPKPASKPAPRPKAPTKAVPAKATQSSFSLGKILGASRGAGAFAGILGMAGIAASMMGSFKQNQYNKGVVSVPGPKGAGDIVPAMLAPGEAVIPAAESKKYAPLIQQMVHGKIPGYESSNVPKIPGFGTNGLPLGPDGRPQTSFIPPQSVPKLGDKIGAALGASKTIAGALVRGVGNVTKESIKIAGQIAASNAQEKALRMMGTGLGGYVQLKDGRIFDQVAQKTYADQASYDAAQKKIREAKAAGTSYTTSSGRTYMFNDAGKAQRLNAEQLKQLAEERKAEQPASKPKLGARMAGSLGTAGMIGSTAGMGMMMSGDPGMQQMGGAVMMGSMLLPMLPMLMNPLGMLAAGLAAAGGAALLIKGHFDKLGEETRKITETLGVGASAMQKYADFAGKVSASELMDKKRTEAISPFSIKAGKNPFGAMFLQSEEGKNIVDSIKKTRSKGGDAQEALLRQLSAAVSGGSLDVTQARSIAYAIAESLGDQNLGMNINAKLTGLFGINGENLLTDPLTVQIRQVSETSSDLESGYQDFIDASNFTAEETVKMTKDTVKRVKKETNALLKEGPLYDWSKTWFPMFTDWIDGLYAIGSEGVAPLGVEFEKAEMTVESANAYIVKAANAIENYQSAVDALDVNYDKQIEAAKAAGDQAKAEELIEKKAKARNDLMIKYAAAIKQVRDQFDKASETGQATLLEASQNRLLEKYKDNADDTSLYKDAKKKLEATGISAGNQYSLNMLLNADAITLSTFDWISSNLDDPEITRVLNLNTKLTGKDLGTVANLLSRFGNEKSRGQFLAKIDLAVDSNAASDIVSTFTEISNLADTLSEKDAKELMDFYVDPKNKEEAIGLMNTIKTLKKFDGEQLTIDYIQNIEGGDKFATIIKGNQKYFESLDKDQRITYTQVIATISMADPGDIMADAQAWQKEQGNNLIPPSPTGQDWWENPYYSDYINYLAESRTEFQKAFAQFQEEDGGDPTTTTQKADPFKDFLTRLRQVRDSSVNINGGIEELMKKMKAGTKATTDFVGTNQKLLYRGMSKDFIDAINGMDEETRKTFVSIKNGIVKVTEEGIALNKALSEIKLGDFQFSLVSGVAAINKQMFAMTRLTSLNKDLGSGALSAAEAFEIVQDESLAYAIATAATAEEVKTLVANFRELKDAQQKLLLSTPEGTQTWLDDYSSKVSDAVSKAKQYIDAQKEIVNQDFETGDNKSGKNKDKLNMGLLSENITKAQESLAEYQYSVDDLQYDLSTIQEIEDKINQKYDERGEALNKIWEANSDIADQQKAQLDIAQALASGDIAAAARAMQEEQRRRAQKAKDDQEKALEAARDKELEAAKSAKGKTRKQLEEEILQLNKKMAKLEEDSIEPNERLLRLAETARNNALEAVGENGYLGQTEKAWAKIEAAARLAVVESEAFKESLKSIIDLIPGFSIKDGKVFFDEAGYKSGIPAPSATVTTPSGVGAGDAPPAGSTPTDKPEDTKPKLNEKNSSYAVVANAVAGLYENLPAAVSKDAKVTDPKKAESAFNAARTGGLDVKGTNITITASGPAEFAKEVMNIVLQNRATANDPTVSKEIREYAKKENIALMAASGLKFAKGGLVPSFFSAGGFAKGTDTVPAMLTPGEFVMRRYAVNQYGTDTMKAINNGTFSGDSVYNYSINVSVKSNANPDDIASSVMSRIKQIDSQRIRSNRY